MYQVRILEAAAQALGRLDKQVAQQVANRVRWLAENVADIKPQPLKGELAGLCKLRVGDYRVIYEILKQDSILMVHFIGHRREVYRQ